MTITLVSGSEWCYAFGCNTGVRPDNVEGLLSSNEDVVYHREVQTGEDRSKLLLIAALDSLIDKRNPNSEYQSRPDPSDKEQIRTLVNMYTNISNVVYTECNNGPDHPLMWELTVALGTSKLSEAYKWLNE